jgi:hypothetical protein
MGPGRCGDRGAGERDGYGAAENESGKLPHENILQLFAVIGRLANLWRDPEPQIATPPF